MKTETAEPRIHTHSTSIPHGSALVLTFLGEQYSGQAVLDTCVKIEEGTLCWITWKDRDAFIQELKAVIDKYAI